MTYDELRAMEKDALIEWAAERGLNLDKRMRMDKLLALAWAHLKRINREGKDEDGAFVSTHLKNPRTGLVFERTEELSRMNGLIACDANGDPV